MTRPNRRSTRLRALGLVTMTLIAVACGSSSATSADERRITVAAASDLRFAFDELGDAFTAETGIEVTFAYGSSGQLREQIINGAPFDLFASANVDFVDDVIEAGRGIEETKADYAVGRIVLWSPPGGLFPQSVADLADSQYRTIAIANPRHAPYGLAAEQALISAGVIEEVRSRLIFGENISDAMRIVESGNADVGIVALSLAIVGDAPYVIVDEDLHEPLRQALVVTSTGERGADAEGFATFLASPEGREVMVRYGFVLPGETVDG